MEIIIFQSLLDHIHTGDFVFHLLTGDPLHSRAACTQPCNVNTHSRAHCSPGARLCEQWGHGCVNNRARLCSSARLCRGSPVLLHMVHSRRCNGIYLTYSRRPCLPRWDVRHTSATGLACMPIISWNSHLVGTSSGFYSEVQSAILWLEIVGGCAIAGNQVTSQ